MFERFKIKKIDEEEVLILYLNYNYEFGIFDTIKDRSKNLMSLINQYIKQHKIEFHGKKIMLVANGILVTSLFVVPAEFHSEVDGIRLNSLELVEVLIPEEKEVIKEENDILENQNSNETIQEIEQIEEIVMNKPSSSLNSTNNSNPSNFSSSIEQAPIVKEPVIETPTEKPIIEESKENLFETNIGKKITVIRSNGTIIQLALEDYIIGVVAGEMPASFHLEALKAQALASRTYALKKISENKTLTDTIQDQVYIDIDQMKNLWKEDFEFYYNKIKTAVLETQGKTIWYQNRLIDAVYFSTSNGFTEDSVYVWNNAFPYLVSVASPWDVNTREYSKLATKSLETVSQKLGIPMTNETSITILERNASNRVVTIQIGEELFSGIELYHKLGLRSRDFDMWIENDTLYIQTRGWGHGVGMSQYGANGMAKEGYKTEEIIKHYYQGVTIQ